MSTPKDMLGALTNACMELGLDSRVAIVMYKHAKDVVAQKILDADETKESIKLELFESLFPKTKRQ